MNPIQIKIFNNPESIKICKLALLEYALQIGFHRKERNKMALLFEEMLIHLCKCTFEKHQEGEITVLMQFENDVFEVKINDFGIPLDEKKIQECKDEEFKHLSNVHELLQAFMDDIQIGAKGYKGNEIVLKKHLHTKKNQKIAVPKEEGKTIKDSSAEIKLLDEKFAADISKLAFFAYHYSYPYESIYIPEKVGDKINQKLLIPAGAVLKEDGSLVSHTALSFSNPNDQTAEIGTAFTNPDYRGHGYINQIWSYLINEIAVEKGLFAVFAMAVCTHPYSQKACHKMGMNDCALLVSRAPAIEFENIDTSAAQRESLMIATKVVNQPDEVVFYPPKQHKEMILKIADHLSLKVKSKKQALLHFESPHNFTNIEIDRNPAFGTAKIFINHYGKDLKKQFASSLHQLKIERIESIYLYLDLADFHTEKKTKIFEEFGFFFAGIMHENNRMNLVLQFLNNQGYDFSTLKIDSDFGQDLLAYVQKEYEKIEVK